MKIQSLKKAWEAGEFARSKRFVERLAASVKTKWEEMVFEKAPAWWGRMALSSGAGGGGGILVKPIPGGLKVYYANKGSYNYMEVIVNGRQSYSIKDALLRSSRAKYSKQIGRYIVVPMTRNDDGSKISPKNNDIGAIMRHTGQTTDAGGQPRKGYRVLSANGQGEAVGMQQGPIKGGGMQHSYMKFVVVSQNSDGWIYPAIPANPIPEKLQSQTDKMLKSSEFKKMVKADVKDFVKRMIKGK
jgi:hypothetical protein